jgi:hypothetical protein
MHAKPSRPDDLAKDTAQLKRTIADQERTIAELEKTMNALQGIMNAAPVRIPPETPAVASAVHLKPDQERDVGGKGMSEARVIRARLPSHNAAQRKRYTKRASRHGHPTEVLRSRFRSLSL